MPTCVEMSEGIVVISTMIFVRELRVQTCVEGFKTLNFNIQGHGGCDQYGVRRMEKELNLREMNEMNVASPSMQADMSSFGALSRLRFLSLTKRPMKGELDEGLRTFVWCPYSEMGPQPAFRQFRGYALRMLFRLIRKT